MKIILAITGICLFGAASLTALLAIFKPGREWEKRIRLITIVAAIPFVLILAMIAVQDGRVPAFGRFEAITWFCLSLTGAYLHLSIKEHMQGISGIVLPAVTAMLAFGLSGINTSFTTETSWPTMSLTLHVLTAFIGYALFSLSGVLAVCYIIQDFNLKHKRFGAVFERLPSLESLDALMRRQIGLAFVIFTTSILFGINLVRQTGSTADWYADPKVTSTAATWMVYAILLHLRTGGDRHGKKIAIATIAGILFVVFAFVGVHMLTDSKHDFVFPALEEQQK